MIFVVQLPQLVVNKTWHSIITYIPIIGWLFFLFTPLDDDYNTGRIRNVFKKAIHCPVARSRNGCNALHPCTCGKPCSLSVSLETITVLSLACGLSQIQGENKHLSVLVKRKGKVEIGRWGLVEGLEGGGCKWL